MGSRRPRSDRAVPLPSRIELEVREEIRFYLEMRARELESEGMSPTDAWRAAVEAFGDPAEVVESAVRERPDETDGRRGGVDVMAGMLQDLRYAARNLRQTPGFTAAVVLTLALGLGGATAIFSVVSGVLLRPLPFPEPENLVAIHTRWTAESGYEWDRYPLGSPEYFDYIAQNRTLQSVGAVSTERLTYRPADGDPRLLTAGVVSPSVFDVLRVPPYLGRTLLEEDGGPEPAPVAVLTYGFWQREFGGDSTVVGRTLELGWEIGGNQVSSVVVGVMPPGFTFPDPDVELWAPLLLDPERVWREGHWFSAIARVAPGSELQDAEVDMAGIMHRWRDDYPDHHRGHFLYLTPLLDDMVADVRPTLMLLFGAVGFLLLIACANVASLLLARGSYRSREIAVRSALGAGRGRLFRQLLAEALLLALLGGVAGLLLAGFGVDALLALEGGEIPRGAGVGLDGPVLGFASALIAITTVVFGVLPAHRATSTNLARAFSDGGRWASPGRDRLHLRKSLVVGEVSLALLLVVGAGLMAKSFWTTLNQDPGFDAHNLLSARISFPDAGYTPEEKVALMMRLAERVRSMPGVADAGVTSRPPILFETTDTRFEIEGRPELQPGEPGPTASMVMVDPHMFEVLGMRALRGRIFDATDQADVPPVALIDEEAARRYWPGEDPIGRRIRFGLTDGDMRTIVGVVNAVRWDGLTVRAPTIYEPAAQAMRWTWFHLANQSLMVRTLGDPSEMASPVRDALRELDPKLPIVSMRTMEDLVRGSLATPRFILTLLALFGLVALALGIVGIYGVVAQAVAQRSNEIGIRRALGAGARQVQVMVLGQGLRLAAVGVVLGVLLALMLNRVLTGFLHQVSPTDPLTYAVVAGVVIAAAVVATLVPAHRASRVDPMEVLRKE